MKKYTFILFLCLAFQLNAQKTIAETIEDPTIKTIVINDDKIFKIKINTSFSKTIKLQSRIEGEYTKDIVVSAETKNDTLFISSSFQPFYKVQNNKLSAHKVLSVEVFLDIPENLKLYVKSAIASAEIKGNYKSLTLELSQGNSIITEFRGDAIINSVNGNISLETNYTSIYAKSKTGIVNVDKLTSGTNQIKLNTINGNISVIKTEK